MSTSIVHNPSDLSFGDRVSSEFDWTEFQVCSIDSVVDPAFDLVYEELWKEFGPKGEMEQRSVISQRMHWRPTEISGQFSLCYELISVMKKKGLAAARDHSVIIRHGIEPLVVVHLSHSLIMPEFRGSGMIGWLRAWPIRKAKECLKLAGISEDVPIILVAEMEPCTPQTPERMPRLRSYQRGDFLMLEPSAFSYFQPDFRLPEDIDRSGGPSPIPMRLVMRRVGREQERIISGSEVKSIVSCLYHMFEKSFRPQDMRGLWNHLEATCPPANARLALVEPLSTIL